MRLLILFFFINFNAISQNQFLILGNSENVCIQEKYSFKKVTQLPERLVNYKAIFIFSNSTSSLSEKDIEKIINFVENGGGLYSGSENWPLQAEANQLTTRLFEKQSYGNYTNKKAEIKRKDGDLHLEKINEIPAGETTVAFPMDYRLKVEAWIDDQPLILSGNIGKGKIIIDGGYSRFYCNQWNENVTEIFNQFLFYLIH